MLLHYAGEHVHSIYRTLESENALDTTLGIVSKIDAAGAKAHLSTSAEDEYQTAVYLLNNYFQLKRNIDYETYKFRKSKQETTETFTVLYQIAHSGQYV